MTENPLIEILLEICIQVSQDGRVGSTHSQGNGLGGGLERERAWKNLGKGTGLEEVHSLGTGLEESAGGKPRGRAWNNQRGKKTLLSLA